MLVSSNVQIHSSLFEQLSTCMETEYFVDQHLSVEGAEKGVVYTGLVRSCREVCNDENAENSGFVDDWVVDMGDFEEHCMEMEQS